MSNTTPTQPSHSPSNAPVPKVMAATLGGAAATIVVVIVAAITENDVPAGVEGAVAVLFAFLAGYIAPPRER